MRFLRFTDDEHRFLAYNGPTYVDGYGFGDRLLEGVAFQLIIKNNKKGEPELSARPSARDAGYVEKLNAKKWCAEAVKYVLEPSYLCSSANLMDQDLILYRPGVPHFDQDLPDSFTIVEEDGSETQHSWAG